MDIMHDPNIDPERCPPELSQPVGLIEVPIGPTMRTALDVLELVAVMLDDVPEGEQRKELYARTNALIEICERELQERPHAPQA